MARKKKKFKLNKTQTYALIFFLFMLAIFFINEFNLRYNKSPVSMSELTTKYDVTFLYVNDGDTAVFLDRDTKEEITCRFLAVDSPEIDEEGYNEAKSFTNMKLRNARKIVLELDPNSERYDKFDRLLAWVWIDGDLLQAKLIENDLVKIRYIYGDYLYTEYLERIINQKE